MHIAICDDDKRQCKKIGEQCQLFMGKYNIMYEISNYFSATELVQGIEKEPIDLLILDIEMPQMTGIDLKNYLQFIGQNILVIFVTSHTDLMAEAFGLCVIGFVDKAKLDTMLETSLSHAMDILTQHVLLNGEIDSNDIMYIQAEHIYSQIHTIHKKKILWRQSLSELEKQLKNAGFCRIHRSYLVNLKYLDEFKRKEVILRVEDSKVKLPVSRSRAEDAKKSYKEYCRKNARYC